MPEIESEIERSAGSIAFMTWLTQQPKVPPPGTIFEAGWLAGREYQRHQQQAAQRAADEQGEGRMTPMDRHAINKLIDYGKEERRMAATDEEDAQTAADEQGEGEDERRARASMSGR